MKLDVCFLYRVAAAAELTELHDRLGVEVQHLQNIHTTRYSVLNYGEYSRATIHVTYCTCM